MITTRRRPSWSLVAGLCLLAAASGCRRKRFPSRGDAASVVIVDPRALLDDAGKPLPPEREPNNTAATAHVLPLEGDPLVALVAGSLVPTGKTPDVDVFKLVIPGIDQAAAAIPSPDGASATPVAAARRLIVDLQPEPGLAPVLQLLDAASKPVVTSSSPPGERDGLPNVAVAPGGTYYLRIRADRPTHPPDAGVPSSGYRIVVRVVDFELGDEREPNDRAAQATDLGNAQSSPEVAGFFGWRKDEDWYRLPVDGLPAGSILDVELEGLEGVTSSVAIHDAAGARVAVAHGRKSERVVLRNVAVSFPATAPVARDGSAGAGATVYVVAHADAGRNLERRYTLRVHAEMAREGTETEPNDTAAHASPLADGLTSGFLAPGDVDLFRYAPAGPVALDVEVMPPDRVNVKVEVLREKDGQLIASADAAGRRQPERLTNVAVDEPVLLRLTQRRGDGNSDEPYQVRLASRVRAEPAP